MSNAVTIDRLMAYEQDGLAARDCVLLFSDLVRTGIVNQLQGHYGRTAAALIDGGILAPDGSPLVDLDALSAS